MCRRSSGQSAVSLSRCTGRCRSETPNASLTCDSYRLLVSVTFCNQGHARGMARDEERLGIMVKMSRSLKVIQNHAIYGLRRMVSYHF